jgi:hypothetical protein
MKDYQFYEQSTCYRNILIILPYRCPSIENKNAYLYNIYGDYRVSVVENSLCPPEALWGLVTVSIETLVGWHVISHKEPLNWPNSQPPITSERCGKILSKLLRRNNVSQRVHDVHDVDRASFDLLCSYALLLCRSVLCHTCGCLVPVA